MAPDLTHLDRRPGTLADMEDLGALIDATAAGYTIATFGVYDPEKARALLRDTLPDGTWTILSVAGERLGAMRVLEDDEGVSLEQIFLEPRWHGQGWGSAIASELVADAHTRGRAVRLRVMRANPARNLYLRLGFHVVRETAERWFMENAPS